MSLSYSICTPSATISPFCNLFRIVAVNYPNTFVTLYPVLADVMYFLNFVIYYGNDNSTLFLSLLFPTMNTYALSFEFSSIYDNQLCKFSTVFGSVKSYTNTTPIAFL